MRKLKVDDGSALLKMWEKNFLNEASKFIAATYLATDDLGREFKDEKNDTWKILGHMDGKDIPCRKIETNEIFVWDRWKVSSILYPERHAALKKNIEYVAPPKPKRGKKTEIAKEETNQLDLFD